MAKFRNITVVGGGLMGAGIAQVFASADFHVTVFEPDHNARASLHDRIGANLELMGEDASALVNLHSCGSLGDSVADSDFVTEAAPEKLELKQAIFAELENLVAEDTILASNTSVIPIGRITKGLQTAHRMVGTHWWNPPYLVPLVEVVQAEHTSLNALDRVMELLHKVGKKPAHVRKDVPGFVANRLQHALWREAIAMVAEGICDARTLDSCVKNSFGLRLPVLGPLENADMVGLDLTLDIHNTIIRELDSRPGPNPYLEQKVREGKLGFKTGEGFRAWEDSEQINLKETLTHHLVTSQNYSQK